MPSAILEKSTVDRLDAVRTGVSTLSTDSTINAVLDTLEESIKAQEKHLKYLRELTPKLKKAAAKVKKLKRYKLFVEWLDQHPELDKTEIIGLFVNQDYGQIALRYANFDFPEGLFPEN